jgi:hypothetical protein
VIPFQERCMNRGNGWMSLFWCPHILMK